MAGGKNLSSLYYLPGSNIQKTPAMEIAGESN